MRRRLSVLVFAVTSMVVVSFIVPLGLLVKEQAADRALGAGQRTAQSVAAALAVASTLDPAGITPAAAETVIAITDPGGTTTVFLPDGSIAGAEADPSVAVATALTGVALTTETATGVEVLVPVAGTDGTYVVRTFLSGTEITDGVARAWMILVLLGLILIAAAVLLADRLGRTTVRPITELSKAARAVSSGNLDVRVEPDGPLEVAALGRAFNDLTDRLDDLMAAERESVADLSHRLRTPLTSLRLQAERVAGREASERLLEDIDRLGRQVDGLITEARRGTPAGPRRADLATAAADKSAFWAILADEQGRVATVTVPGHEVMAACTPPEAADAVEALLENVFSHTDAGVPYSVTVTEDEKGAAILVIEDGGPGFPRGFSPGRGVSGGESTGLGLDIAIRAAVRSGGDAGIDRSPGLGGARVTLRFGSPAL
ncbi:HAMP domain-containing histidine kinase [bacterium]|nr:HAMP domain-containing histidine kinase [bacterium]